MTDKIIIKYKIDNNEKIRIFGKTFVENNKNFCKIKANGIESDLNFLYYHQHQIFQN